MSLVKPLMHFDRAIAPSSKIMFFLNIFIMKRIPYRRSKKRKVIPSNPAMPHEIDSAPISLILFFLEKLKIRKKSFTLNLFPSE